MNFFEELKRRNVFRVGIAYGVADFSDVISGVYKRTNERYGTDFKPYVGGDGH